jgi:hypothetical protein
MILLVVAYVSDSAIDSFKNYLSTDEEQYSGLFVQADELFDEESAERNLAVRASIRGPSVPANMKNNN